MSIAFEMHHGMLPFMGVFAENRQLPVEEDSCSSSSSSSIGRDSDDDSGDETTEVQSSRKEGPLDSMDVLQEVLPIRRGISKFYNGKSKSFTSLEDASSVSSVKDFAKPESLFNRKRKNMLVHRDKNRNFPSRDNVTGLSKRPSSTFPNPAVGSASSCSRANNVSEDFHSVSSSPPCLPPLHPHAKRSPSNGVCSQMPRQNLPWRSFSLSDLQAAATTTSDV
ncbi:hypothetical protein Tsubulata_047280 [Turnera subulata]|uniref:Uncharacterized protein n=1 Tax=Turnera subulata TaxID=218843 RepID=A0A9Q0GGU9_9ROSI|nr:hypothetical protein Tsubulata_047280 [Turnera subulata]